MMFNKVMIALLPMLALVSPQATNLTNVQELDPANPGNFRLYWEVLPVSGDIVLQFLAKAKGWLSFLIVSPDGTYGDVFLGGFNDLNNETYGGDYSVPLSPAPHGNATLDSSNDIILQGSVFHDPSTIVRIKRSLNTGDKEDVVIGRGLTLVGWSYHSTSDDATQPHTAAGFANVTFIP